MEYSKFATYLNLIIMLAAIVETGANIFVIIVAVLVGVVVGLSTTDILKIKSRKKSED